MQPVQKIEEVKLTFGQLVTLKREQFGYTKEYVAKTFGVSTNCIWYYETDRGKNVDSKMAKNLIEFYKITPEEIKNLKVQKIKNLPLHQAKYINWKEKLNAPRHQEPNKISEVVNCEKIEFILKSVTKIHEKAVNLPESGILAQSLKSNALTGLNRVKELLEDMLILDKLL